MHATNQRKQEETRDRVDNGTGKVNQGSVRALQRTKTLLSFITACLLAGCVSRESDLRNARTPYLGLFVDEKAEKAHGPFPLDRAVYARIVSKAARLGAKAVVVKAFLDEPGTAQGDAAFALASKGVPVFLQARLANGPGESRALDPRFSLGEKRQWPESPGADHGAIPLQGFQASAAGVGFIDQFAEPPAFFVPTAIRYRERVYPSLTYAVLRFAFGSELSLEQGKALRRGKQEVTLTQSGETYVALSEAPEVPVHSVADFLSENLSPGLVAGKIVVLGYEGEKLPPLRVPGGEMAPHRAFLKSLASLHATLAAE